MAMDAKYFPFDVGVPDALESSLSPERIMAYVNFGLGGFDRCDLKGKSVYDLREKVSPLLEERYLLWGRAI